MRPGFIVLFSGLFLLLGCDNQPTGQAARQRLLAAISNQDLNGVFACLREGVDPNFTDVNGDTPLILAVQADLFEITVALLDYGADPNIKDSTYRTPLNYAIENDSTKVTNALIKSGASYDLATTSSFTPMMKAVENGNRDIVNILVQAGVDPNDSLNQYPLIEFAVMNKDLEMVRLLRDLGAELDVPGICGESMLCVAAVNCSREILELLIEAGIDVNERGGSLEGSPLYYAAGYGNESGVEVLLEHDAEVDSFGGDGRTPLMYAAGCGKHKVAGMMIKAGADVNLRGRESPGNTALHECAGNGHTEVIRVLLEAGADPNVLNSEGVSPLTLAARWSGAESIQLLVDAGAEFQLDKGEPGDLLRAGAMIGDTGILRKVLEQDENVDYVNCNDWSALWTAVNFDKPRSVRVLLEFGAGTEVADSFGQTPLQVAAGKGYGEIVDLLLSAGADPDAQSKTGRAPLHFAASAGYAAIVKTLLKAGADPSIGHEDGGTPLHGAAYVGNEEIVKLLIAAGADVNKQAGGGWVPLHTAAYYSQAGVVKLLLKAGADPAVQNGNGDTALDIAKQRAAADVVALLE